MKYLFLSLCLSLIQLFSQSQTANIILKITNIEDIKGNMSIALFKDSNGFPNGDQYYVGKKIPVSSKNFKYVFKDIPLGTYAIAIYQDLDKNGELNSNWFGIPKEPYGFSNNAKGKMGPPDFKDALFELKQDMELSIELIN